jgi:hypothetical protein
MMGWICRSDGDLAQDYVQRWALLLTEFNFQVLYPYIFILLINTLYMKLYHFQEIKMFSYSHKALSLFLKDTVKWYDNTPFVMGCQLWTSSFFPFGTLKWQKGRLYCGFLGCDTMKSCKWFPVFQRRIVIRFFWTVSDHLHNYMMSQPRRSQSTFSVPSEAKICRNTALVVDCMNYAT